MNLYVIHADMRVAFRSGHPRIPFVGLQELQCGLWAIDWVTTINWSVTQTDKQADQGKL